MIQGADNFLDADEQLMAYGGLGEEFYEVFEAPGEERISAQVRNLQQIVVSARRLADVEDFIKNQMGKEKLDKQGRLGPWRKVGDKALQQLALLREKANSLSVNEEHRLQLRLHLARGWVRAVVGAFLFKKAQREVMASYE
jgi:hypothetical protein